MRIHKGDVVKHFKGETLTEEQVKITVNYICTRFWILQGIQKPVNYL